MACARDTVSSVDPSDPNMTLQAIGRVVERQQIAQPAVDAIALVVRGDDDRDGRLDRRSTTGPRVDGGANAGQDRIAHADVAENGEREPEEYLRGIRQTGPSAHRPRRRHQMLRGSRLRERRDDCG